MTDRALRMLRSGTVRTSAAVLVLLLLASVMAAVGRWVFSAPGRTGSVWRVILEDRWTLGFVRLALLAGCVHVAASAVAHIVNGRWIRALSTSGVEIDRGHVAQQVQALEAQVEDLVKERDLMQRLLREALGG